MKFSVKNIKGLLSTLPGKISLLLFCIILILVILIDAFVVVFSTSILNQNIKDSISSSTFQTSKYFDQILERAKDVSFQIATNETIQKYINVQKTSKDDYEKLEWKKNAQKALLSIIAANKFISSIYILIDKDSSLGYPTISFDNIEFNKLKSAGWAKAAMESQQGFIWCSDHNQYFYDVLKEVGSDIRDYSTSVVRVLYDASTGDKAGLIVVDIGKDTFDEILSGIKVTQNSISFVVTPDRKVIAKSDLAESFKDKIGTITNELFARSEKKETDIFEFNISGKWLVSYSQNPDNGFLYGLLLPISDITSKISKLQIFIILVSLVFGILAIMTGLFITLKITKNIKVLLKLMMRASVGDLTATSDISSHDEIGLLSDGFNKMANELGELIKKVKNLVEKVNKSISTIASVAAETTAASNEVAKAISEIAQGASDQANEATGIFNEMSEFTKEIMYMVEDFNKMNSFAQDVLIRTDKGFSSIETLRQVANNSQNTTKDMILRVRELVGWVEKIGKIMNLLSSISEQTRLLALNASIEAAKAGESGKGFAIVAGEIRKLAQQSRESTKDIEEIIRNILSKAKLSEKVVDNVEKMIDLQETSLKNVETTFLDMKKAISDLFEGLQKSAKMLESINLKKDKIFNSVENISAISQQTAASAQEVSAATEQQLASIEELKNMIGSLKELSEDLEKTTLRFVTQN